MKIAAAGKMALDGAAAKSAAGAHSPRGPAFRSVMESVRNARSGAAGDLFGELSTIREKIQSGKTIPINDLLIYQMRSSDFNLRVELVSKAAESFVATLRKFQTNP